MSQAEIAGGKISPAGAVPRPGYRLRDFSIKATGREARLSDYRGRSNLILVFSGPRADSDLMRQLACSCDKIREQDAEWLVIRSGEAISSIEWQVPIPVFADSDQGIYRDYGLLAPDPIPAIFIADRFGELIASYLGAEVRNATTDSILKWLEFINSQCPECEPSEWPLEDG
jgi:peroxiredoxin